MPDFSKRSTEDELMDDFSLGHETIDPIMDELEVINKLLGGYEVFFNAFDKIHLVDGMSVADWGCGGGDSLRTIAHWARKKGLKINLIGVDATPSAIEYAKQKSISYPEIQYIVADVLSENLRQNQFDIVISSLFTHHFQDQYWVELIKKMRFCAKRAVVVNDLHRHWLAYYSIAILTSLFSKSEMVKHDSKVSVMRSFTKKDLKSMLAQAEISTYSIRWMWAFRWQLIIYT